MTKNSSRFSTLAEAIIKDVKSRSYLYSGIYPDNMIEIGADLAGGVGRLTLNVEQIVCTLIQSLSFDKQVFFGASVLPQDLRKKDCSLSCPIVLLMLLILIYLQMKISQERFP